MKNQKRLLSFLGILMSGALLTSCYTEDPGSLQEAEKSYAVSDFDRLEMGSAFNIEVTQGEHFDVFVRGDSRNIDDLYVRTVENKLVIDYGDDHHHNRKHTTYIYITMPGLRSINFSGASESRITGFSGSETFTLNLSGASKSDVDIDAEKIDIGLSGASHLKFAGAANELFAEVSGASELNAFNLVADEAHVSTSGASHAKVNVTTSLYARASGASKITYRGEPAVTKSVSGASSVSKD